ncbi:MAG: aminotransferase class IV [Bacteroidales bacterium]|nr:aminotransferase class IV [Bacteroidales bacterium]
MRDFIGHKFISDGDVKPFSAWNEKIFKGHSIIYEVIRVEEGIPLFFDDYYERLNNSFLLVNKQLTHSYNYLISTISKLFEINGYTNGPVKLLFRYDEPTYFVAYLMKPYVPTLEEYNTGVHTMLLHKERVNPNAKVWNQQMRDHTIMELKKAKAFEGILVNEEGFITEGSRSNIFFVKEGIVYTAPDDLILPGVTRKKVLQLCESKGIEVKRKKIHSSQISSYEAVFLTGTSRKVLPVKTIDITYLSVQNDTMLRIIIEFEKFVTDYISRYKKSSSR